MPGACIPSGPAADPYGVPERPGVRPPEPDGMNRDGTRLLGQVSDVPDAVPGDSARNRRRPGPGSGPAWNATGGPRSRHCRNT